MSNEKKYLIFGINGMAGHMIAYYLTEQGRSVTGFATCDSPICKTILGDAMNLKDIGKVIASDDYDYIVNAIGILNCAVDRDLARGIYLNSVLPHEIARRIQDKPAKLIQISSDCVYEGTQGGYKESDFPDAKSYYGRTKALGEVIDDSNLVLRTSIVGPELKTNGVGLFHWFMSQQGNILGYKKVIWSGVTTLQLAKAILQDETNPQTGLVHLCNNNSICKYDLLRLFNQYCREDKVDIEENQSIASDRSIISTRRDVDYKVPDYETMVKEMADWIRFHPELYKQYLH